MALGRARPTVLGVQGELFIPAARSCVLRRDLGKRQGNKRIAALAPGIEASLERANAFNAIFSEEQRHTGAGSFVGSSAIEDDFAVARQAVVFLFQFFRVHVKRTGDRLRIGFEIQGVAEVDDHDFLAGIEFLL